MSQAGQLNSAAGPLPPSVATSYVENSGTAVPAANILDILAALAAAGSTPITTTGATNVVTINVQTTQAIASTDSTKVGLAAFNSAQFTVDVNGFVSITNFSPFNYVQINTASSPYTASATDLFISCDSTAGPITIKLPNAPTTFREFIIKDRTGQSSVNNIFITTVGGAVTIDGQTTYTLADNLSSVQLLFNGTSYEVY